jgi:hypothetical protein
MSALAFSAIEDYFRIAVTRPNDDTFSEEHRALANLGRIARDKHPSTPL